MTFLLFLTEDDATAAELQIRQNVLAYAEANIPERVLDASLIGLNAATGAPEPTRCLTSAWSIPAQAAEGWVIPKPTAGDIGAMTITEFLSGVGGQDIESPTFPPGEPATAIP